MKCGPNIQKHSGWWIAEKLAVFEDKVSSSNWSDRGLLLSLSSGSQNWDRVFSRTDRSTWMISLKAITNFTLTAENRTALLCSSCPFAVNAKTQISVGLQLGWSYFRYLPFCAWKQMTDILQKFRWAVSTVTVSHSSLVYVAVSSLLWEETRKKGCCCWAGQ